MNFAQYWLTPSLPKPTKSYFSYALCVGIIILSVSSLKYGFGYNVLDFNQDKSYNSSKSEIVMHSSLNIINLDEPITENFTCLKTTKIFQVIRTTICLHHVTDYISSYYRRNSIFEQEAVHVLFRIFLKYPHLGLIDIGANIGAYTMFAAAMNRFVVAIECFRPNYMRLAKAIQIEQFQKNVILIGNALYSQLGVNLHLSNDPGNIGGQATDNSRLTNQSSDNPYVVKTMRFDDLLPIIKKTKMRSFLLKADIEGSEYHIFESGRQVLDYLDIPVILVEWVWLSKNKERATNIVNLLVNRQYIATLDTCIPLNMTEFTNNWPMNVYWIKINSSEIC
ncbi:unnamed protein product [Rotaria magnacalcarata]|uniref:Methyltransferase FkbM domain-containing protein n=1 Tax=Rotaria magnacalcarata TaxID=392030 RepID=A0A819EHC6_9BILA|nr:unnamed protein product [Rotaria magnacalcarata]CAF1563965.1 unnamed protein product [Rotaria magnacalcarata]CAF2032812.1 unnamed protein product [Rotaria magnacalcarata]CAF2107665.1 unnamed protein product [Rotaria magnacalcarata]CAF2141312.1 unnamed protein product [Rotaria magnacalcarata]